MDYYSELEVQSLLGVEGMTNFSTQEVEAKELRQEVYIVKPILGYINKRNFLKTIN